MAHTQARGKRMRISKNRHSYNEHDYISKLPDHVLLNILDKLPTEDAMTTSVLSWRWSNLWKSLSVIDLNDQLEKERGKKITEFVNNFMKLHDGGKIKRFCVSLRYDSKKSKTYKKWMDFAVKKKVEELLLDLNHKENRFKRSADPNLPFPDDLFNCYSLVRLKLTFARLNFLPPLGLTSLKELHLNKTELSDDATEIITANCPLLDHLLLSNCNRYRNLKITIAPTSNLSKLFIKEDMCIYGLTEISVNAPRITKLEFLSNTWRRIYTIENVPSVIEATLSFDECFSKFSSFTYRSEEVQRALDGLLEKFQAVKALRVCSLCIQYLTIRELRNQTTLSFDLTRLTLETRLRTSELPGIAFLLRACYRVEHLFIIITAKRVENEATSNLVRESDFVAAQFWKTPCFMQKLTYIEFKNSWGYYETWETGNFDVHKFFTRCENGVQLLSFLMATSPKLERVVFTTGEQQHQINCSTHDKVLGL